MSNDTTAMKTCTKCGESYPATSEYYNKERSGLMSWCKQCAKAYHRQYYEENRDKMKKLHRKWHEANRDKEKEQKRQYREANPLKVKEKEHQYREANRNRINAYHRKHYQENRDKEKERGHKYRKANREKINEYQHKYYEENRDKVKERDRKYREANPDKGKEQSRKYYQENHDKVKERQRKWREANPEQVRLYTSRRRARKLALPDTFTIDQDRACIEYWHGCCAVCGSQLRDLFGDTVPHRDHWIPISSDDCPGTIATNMICLCNHCNHSKSATMPDVWLKARYGTKKANQILARIQAYFDSLVD